jgi:hypothetical protein
MMKLNAAQDDLLRTKYARIREIEKAYDDRTNHSRDAAQQSVWAARIRGWRRAGQVTWP